MKNKLNNNIVITGKKSANKSYPSLIELFPSFSGKDYRQKIQTDQDNVIKELKKHYINDGIVLYLGAGVSSTLGIPTWDEMINLLTITMMTKKVSSAISTLKNYDEKERANIIFELENEIYNEIISDKYLFKKNSPIVIARTVKESLGKDFDYLLARSLFSRLSRRMRFNLMRNKSNNNVQVVSPCEYLPSSHLLDSIVTLARSERDIKGVKAIVNYNFDDIVDEKLRKENVRCKTVLSSTDRVPQATLPCYHVHGVIPINDYYSKKQEHFIGDKNIKAKGNFVFSEEQYHDEYSDPYRWSNMTQMRLLGSYSGLFIGLSMDDPNIRRLIDVTHKQYPDIHNYVIIKRRGYKKGEKPSKRQILRNLIEDVENNSYKQMGLMAIWVNEFSDIPMIIKQICTVDNYHYH